MTSDELKARLSSHMKGDIATDKETLTQYSTDASIFKITPKVVVFPRDVADLSSLVRFVATYNQEKPADVAPLSLTGRSAGTDMTGGPITESIVVAFERYFDQFSVEDLDATIQPGVFFRDFEKVTDEKGVMMPSYPASKSISALGGIIMNNAAGEKTLRYGKTERYVKEMKMVLRDGNEYTFGPLSRDELEAKKKQDDVEGEIYRNVHELLEANYDQIQAAQPDVTKNSSGYALWDVWNRETSTFDMTKLFVGSQGTLGLMSSARMKLVKRKPKTRLGVVFLDSLEPLPGLVNKLLPLEPESLETFDDHTLALALRFFPGIAKKVPGENLFTLAWKFLPEFLIGIKMLGMPKLIVLAHFAEESDETVDKKLAEFEAIAHEAGVHYRVMREEQEAEKYWVIRRESFNLLRQHVKGRRTAPFVDDIVVQPKYLPEVMPKVYEILDKYKVTTTLAGHAGSGNMHLIPLMDLSKEEERQKIPAVSKEVFELVLKYKGSISAEHGDGLVRGPYLEQMFGTEVYNLFRDVKRIFDPGNIFNPGKKVDVDYDFAMEHIDPKV